MAVHRAFNMSIHDPYHDSDALNFELTENGTLRDPSSTPVKRTSYKDGTTIDWQREEEAERERKHRLRSQHGVRGLLSPAIDASRMWFVIVLTGGGIGLAGVSSCNVACIPLL